MPGLPLAMMKLCVAGAASVKGHNGRQQNSVVAPSLREPQKGVEKSARDRSLEPFKHSKSCLN
jgi:hypothetical protein